MRSVFCDKDTRRVSLRFQRAYFGVCILPRVERSFVMRHRLPLPIGFGIDAFAAKLNVLKPIVPFALRVRYGIPSPGEFAMTVETFDAFDDHLTARHRRLLGIADDIADAICCASGCGNRQIDAAIDDDRERDHDGTDCQREIERSRTDRDADG